MSKVLLIHKASLVDDVSINITELNNGDAETCQQEGKGIADALWNAIPASTYEAMMVRFNELEEELKAAEDDL